MQKGFFNYDLLRKTSTELPKYINTKKARRTKMITLQQSSYRVQNASSVWYKLIAGVLMKASLKPIEIV